MSDGGKTGAAAGGSKRIVLVGSPNVGKSLLFNNLTGAYATVSNYPGTTVELTQGTAERGGTRWAVVDTPGMYSLLPTSEEERVGVPSFAKGGATLSCMWWTRRTWNGCWR